jgi:hypothetical protein
MTLTSDSMYFAGNVLRPYSVNYNEMATCECILSYIECPDEGMYVVKQSYCRLRIFPNTGFMGPPLWSSGQSSWLQIRRPGFDSRSYQKKSSGSGKGFTQPREYN